MDKRMSCKYYFFVKLLLKTVLKNLFFTVKLNGGRNIVGILRGFDPFMNLVIDETVEGMVVCLKLTWYT
jgi:small nuclear ribonucleoprotein (snRNP)-like protein